MAYTITNTSGSTSYTVADGHLDAADLDLVLVGRGYVGYGNTLNLNFLKLLENFSNTSPPARPVTGQLWYDSLNAALKVYNGTSFVSTNYFNFNDETIGGIRFYNSSISGQINNANINIVPNGAGATVVSNLAITGTSTGKLLYTAANGIVQSTTMSYTTSGDTLTVTNINGTAFAGTSGSFNIASITGNATIGNAVVSTAVYSPSYFYANGLSFSSSNYGNTQVAAFLAANPQAGTYGNTQVAAYLPIYSGNSNAAFFTGNGYYLTGMTSYSYSNSNVAAYLPTYSGNLSAGNLSAGNLSAGNVKTTNGVFWSNGVSYNKNTTTKGLSIILSMIFGG
jgi:hypothetical protein